MIESQPREVEYVDTLFLIFEQMYKVAIGTSDNAGTDPCEIIECESNKAIIILDCQCIIDSRTTRYLRTILKIINKTSTGEINWFSNKYYQDPCELVENMCEIAMGLISKNIRI